MNSRHLVDPELLEALDASPSEELTLARLPEIRAARAAEFARVRPTLPAFPEIEVREEYIPGPSGASDVRVMVYSPKQRPKPTGALVWIHGGGYVLGTADADELQHKTIVSQVGCTLVSVDYRLAPEHPFPASVEDCYAALAWVHQRASDLGVDPSRIAIGGGSAGGGLAAALGLLARDRGEFAVVFQLLLVPMLDDRTVTDSDPHAYTGEFIWTRAKNLLGWTSLLGKAPGSPNVSPYAAPARAASLEGLPATYIGTGALDLFLEEDLEYARRLTRAGVPTELHLYPGAFHGFGRATAARVTHAYQRDFLQALNRALEPALAPAPSARSEKQVVTL
jgi:acetyl esterase/lipase